MEGIIFQNILIQNLIIGSAYRERTNEFLISIQTPNLLIKNYIVKYDKIKHHELFEKDLTLKEKIFILSDEIKLMLDDTK